MSDTMDRRDDRLQSSLPIASRKSSCKHDIPNLAFPSIKSTCVPFRQTTHHMSHSMASQIVGSNSPHHPQASGRSISTTAIPRPLFRTSRPATPPAPLLRSILPDPGSNAAIPMLSPLRIRHPSHALQDPSKHVTSPSRVDTVGPKVAKAGLPKSSTYTSLASSRHGLIPQRLVQPIYPPLPRSQTLSNMTCFRNPDPTLPIKSPREVSFVTNNENNGGDKGDLSVCSGNSRAISRGSTTSGRYWGEASSTTTQQLYQDKNSSQNVQDPRWPHDHTAQASGPEKCITITSRTCDSYKNKGARLLINATLANTPRREVESAFSSPKSGSAGSQGIRSEASSPDPRYVHTAESAAYWTGRFVAISDRIRQTDCTALTRQKANDSPLSFNSDVLERLYDDMENSLQERTLQELGSFCRSKAATKSFAKFEMQLLNPEVTFPRFLRSRSDVFWRHGSATRTKSLVTGLMPVRVNTTEKPVGNFSIPTVQVTNGDVQPTFSGTSKPVRGNGLIKSRTTGDLTVTRVNLLSQAAESNGLQQQQETRASQNSYVRKPSNFSRIDPNMTQTLRVEGQPQGSISRITACRSRQGVVDFGTPQDGLMASSKFGQSHQRAYPGTEKHLDETTRRFSSKKLVSETLASQLEPEYDQVGRFTSMTGNEKRTAGPVVEPSDGESQRSAPTGTARQNSSELFKKMMGVSAREVRKMSKRVGSMGWGGSHEDVAAPQKH